MSSSQRSRSRRLKRALGNLLVVVLGLITLLLIVGLFLPRAYVVERSIEVNAKPAAIYPHLATLRHWPEWTAWNQQMDPTVQFNFESPETGAGAAYRWTGTKTGKGRLQLTRAEPEKGVWYDLDFEAGKFLSQGSLTFEGTSEPVRVVWINEGDLGRSPVSRYFGLMMDSILGPDFEKGLANLKARAEATPK